MERNRNKDARLRPYDHRNKGRYAIKCCAAIHNKDTLARLIPLQTRKQVSQSKFNDLIARGIVSPEANYICKKCLEVGSFGSVANDFTDRNSEDSDEDKDDSDAERRKALGEKATDIGKVVFVTR